MFSTLHRQLPREGLTRAQVIAAVPAIIGANPVAGYLPSPADGLTSIDPWSGRTWTAEAPMRDQLLPTGRGFARLFVSAASRWLETPDTNDLSMGDGATDTPFTIFSYDRPTSVAGNHAFFAKTDFSTLQEYRFTIAGTGVLTLVNIDQSALAQTSRASDAGAPVGGWHSYAAVYNSTGGTSNMDGASILVDGETVASTATNSGAYVALENLTNPADAGAAGVHSVQFGDGPKACTLLILGAMAAAVILRLTELFQRYIGRA